MTLAIQQYKDLVMPFTPESGKKGKPVEEKELTRDFLREAIPEKERKTYYEAFIAMKNATLSNWDPEKGPAGKISAERITELNDTLKTKIAAFKAPEKEGEAPKATEDSWYKLPFIWIAKLVDSIWKGFQNTFLGRISNEKLFLELTNHLTELKNAPGKKSELETKSADLKGKIKIEEGNVNKCREKDVSFANMLTRLKQIEEEDTREKSKDRVNAASEEGNLTSPHKKVKTFRESADAVLKGRENIFTIEISDESGKKSKVNLVQSLFDVVTEKVKEKEIKKGIERERTGSLTDVTTAADKGLRKTHSKADLKLEVEDKKKDKKADLETQTREEYTKGIEKVTAEIVKAKNDLRAAEGVLAGLIKDREVAEDRKSVIQKLYIDKVS
ncbi:MAG: hypothetical protein K940chlam7_01436 [Chlamydiae bacterium]|nr:hypothetical protein [Chlamydiota bacterium]